MLVKLNDVAKIMLENCEMEDGFKRDFKLHSLDDEFHVTHTKGISDSYDVTGTKAGNGKEFMLPEFVLIFLN